MSVKAFDWAMRQEDISTAAKLLLAEICNCHNKDDEFAFPDQAYLARRVMKSQRTIRRLTQELIDADRLRMRPGIGLGRGRGRSATRYYIPVCPKSGIARPFTDLFTGPVVLTGGHACPTVSDAPMLTGGQNEPLQADTSVPTLGEEPEKEPELSRNSDPSTDAPAAPSLVADATAREVDLIGEPIEPASPAKAPGKAQVDEAIALYSAAAERAGWIVAKGPHSKARLAAVRARLKDHGLAGWRAQLAAAEPQPHLGGASQRGWRMGLDWFTAPANWTKIAERTYVRDAGGAAAPTADTYATAQGLKLLFDLKHKVPPEARHAYAVRTRWILGNWPSYADQAFRETISKDMIRALNAALKAQEAGRGA